MNNIYISYTESDKRFKAAFDRDCLPDEVTKLASFSTTADIEGSRGIRAERFFAIYDKMRWLEQMGFNVCIDFGDHTYETGDNFPKTP